MSRRPVLVMRGIAFLALAVLAGCGGGPGGDGDAAPGGDAAPDAGTPLQAVQIAAGDDHACALDGDGKLACWGANYYRATGIDQADPVTRPRSVDGVAGVLRVDAGISFTCVVAEGGAVSCWGYGAQGALGESIDEVVRREPEPVPGLPAASPSGLGLGLNLGCAAVEGGAAWCWGLNGAGQLGRGATSAVEPAGPVSVLDQVTAVTGGFHHACAIAGGTLWCWGQNISGELGDGGTEGSPTPVEVTGVTGPLAVDASSSGGGPYTCAVERAGGVLCWGDNGAGQLGDGTSEDHAAPAPVARVSGAVAVRAGPVHACAITGGNELHCWGNNAYGQLGDGTQEPRPEPVRVPLDGVIDVALGYLFTCALVEAGDVYCFGQNEAGQLGNGGADEYAHPTPEHID